MGIVRSVVRGVAAIAVGAAVCGSVLGEDVVYMENGDVWRGQITREGDDFVYIRYMIGSVTQEKFLLRSAIERIERDEFDGPSDGPSIELPPIPEGAGKIAFISLEEMVGPYMNARALEESVELLKDLPETHQPDAVVLWIDSGGGALFELLRLNEYIQEELSKEYRTVSWIRSAISAAAMTAWSTNEIYMMPEGNIGASTGFRMIPGRDGSVAAEPMLGPELDQVLEHMRQVSIAGDHEPWVMWAMQISAPHRPFSLSAEVDPVYGEVTWHMTRGPGDSLPGELVSPHDEILTLNAEDSVRFQVAEGIASSKDELARHMGFTEWVEVGQEADVLMHQFRDSVREISSRVRELIDRLILSLDLAGQTNNRMECRDNVTLAQRNLQELRRLAEQGHSVKEYQGLDDEWFDYWQRRIDDAAERCADMRNRR